nr:putative reverse transcriptase domain-containing protein [Tanacetum cinerariifolium]
MRQRRWIELFSDYDCEIRYHPDKANVVVDALSRKKSVKPKRVRSMNMTLQSSIKDRILATQKEASDDGHDIIWVIMDRLTKSAHFLPMRKDYKMDRSVRLYLNEIVARHGVPISIIYDRDSRFTSRFWQSMQEALGTWKCRFPIMWAKVGEGQLIGPELVQETIEKISQIKDRLKVARDRQKSYDDKKRKPLEFSVGDYVVLKVSPWKDVVRFRKKCKLAPRFVRPFESTERIGPVAYRLRFPEELNVIHGIFHVLNHKKCLADPTLQVPLDEIQVDAKLNFVKNHVEILEIDFKKLKRSRIAIVKVRWNSKRGPEFTWEREDQMKLKGGGRTRGRFGDQGDGRIDGQDGQVGGQGSEVNDGVNGVPDFSTIIAQQLQNLLPTIVTQVGDQGRGQGNGRDQNGDAVNVNIWGDVSKGCTYKDFLACNPKEYDGKEGAIVYTHWIEKMESVRDMSGCRDNQKVKSLLVHLLVWLSRGGTLKSTYKVEKPL